MDNPEETIVVAEAPRVEEEAKTVAEAPSLESIEVVSKKPKTEAEEPDEGAISAPKSKNE